MTNNKLVNKNQKQVEQKQANIEQHIKAEKSNQLIADKQSQDKLTENDFIELAFSGKTKDGEVFDTNILEQAKKINQNIETRLLIVCLGQAMILPAIDEFLIGKSLGKYTLELTPDKAFGNRNPQLVKTMPISVFKNQPQMPYPGMIFQFDNALARISAVSGGRVIVDFNNPLAGKPVVYELNAKKKILDLNEKIKSLILFFFRQDLKFEIKEKKLIIICAPGFEKFVILFKDKFKEILDLELEVEIEKKEVKENAKEEKGEEVEEEEKQEEQAEQD